MSKFTHYGIKTEDNFLAKDSRTNCLEIYEDKLSADRVARRSSQNISVIPCYVYTEKEHVVFDEMYKMLKDLSKEQEHHWSKEIDNLLSKARGEA